MSGGTSSTSSQFVRVRTAGTPSWAICAYDRSIESGGSDAPPEPHIAGGSARAPCGFAFQEGAEHPGHLLVALHEPDEEVVRARVVVLVRDGVGVGAELAD